ncbi:MAG: 4-oxalocrotonate tautomerase family protein [Burkholderiales bacterium]|nr:4-oxalocrotonate tautomerase family protein [Burkholderiales bacterium]
MPYINIKVTGGKEAPTQEQKQELIRGATDLVARILGKNPKTTIVIIEEVSMDNWGIGGESVTNIRAAAHR